MKDQDSKQIERAKDIRVDTLKQAGKQIDKNDKAFAKGELDAGIARTKGYEKASKATDPREAINPTIEEAYWRSAYGKEPYINKNYSFDDYAPAYRSGFMGREAYRDMTWEKAEPQLAADWEKSKGKSRLQWHQAKTASRAAWMRVDHPVA